MRFHLNIPTQTPKFYDVQGTSARRLMLLRQLNRPLLRSVTAAWRPATNPPAPFHQGASRSNSSSSSSSITENGGEQPEENSDGHHEPSPPAPSDTKPSLFDQLFPDEAKLRKSLGAAAWASRFAAEEPPPRVDVPEDFRDDEDVSAWEESELASKALRAESMLILSAASKSLLESDFMHLGAKGKHVEGWVRGILKVIQARNPDTLEPQGHYFILFDTHEAALSYKDRLEHLWKLAKTHLPGAAATHRHHHRPLQPLPRGLRRTDAGEDVAALVRSFTLVPPTQRHHVQLSRLGPARVAELYHAGGFVDRLAAAAGAGVGVGSLVLLRLERGRLPLAALRRAIADDGAARGLAWRVADLDRGILPFGKSILKASDEVHVVPNNAVDGGGGGGGGVGGGGSEYGGSDEFGFLEQEEKEREEKEEEEEDTMTMRAAVLEAEESNQRHRQYPRFIVPFADKAEAYRFVQSWHRRELRLRMGAGGRGQPSWDEERIVNATVLW
ncbi:hypothetical protein SAMD00023353_2400790 [Rosellinia necatrix]|uniref:Uncharacterized protein n=1 Tax=Rosellinia necatrix TaxID=77044 RepID=A0A1W2TFS0_ROSNE|nr:hypothetical protein SAMD00023353_2400790 [Rosellinia necatrix]